ncbi:hypothetical protein C8P63_101169 [Melghirimyces profundicolus]|uniref:Uncharacterized protein n=2 Tax=Melghirimyces profundicolus TaxID=1242148 RepID=A0A2T6C9F3_9BACL|nr:hypothetical protein C8P63_101169 [Melghirimyces profundicolus]
MFKKTGVFLFLLAGIAVLSLTGCSLWIEETKEVPAEAEKEPPPAQEPAPKSEPRPREEPSDAITSRSEYGNRIADYSLDMSDHLYQYSDGMLAASEGNFQKGEQWVRDSVEGMEQTVKEVKALQVGEGDPELKRLHRELADIFEGYLHASEKGLEGLEKKDPRLLNEGSREMNELNLRLETLTEEMSRLLEGSFTVRR